VTIGPRATTSRSGGRRRRDVGAEEIEKRAGNLKDEVNQEQTNPQLAKTRLEEAVELVKERADTLKSRLEDLEPATAEAGMIFDAFRTMEQSAEGLNLSRSPGPGWGRRERRSPSSIKRSGFEPFRSGKMEA